MGTLFHSAEDLSNASQVRAFFRLPSTFSVVESSSVTSTPTDATVFQMQSLADGG